MGYNFYETAGLRRARARVDVQRRAMLPHEIKARIESGIPETQVQVNEFSGGTDHYAVVVVSPAFEGQALLKRHRMVLDLFQAEIGTGEVHALSIKAYTPAQWEVEKTVTRFF